jgi:hypothetical protein
MSYMVDGIQHVAICSGSNVFSFSLADGQRSQGH